MKSCVVVFGMLVAVIALTASPTAAVDPTPTPCLGGCGNGDPGLPTCRKCEQWFVPTPTGGYFVGHCVAAGGNDPGWDDCASNGSWCSGTVTCWVFNA